MANYYKSILCVLCCCMVSFGQNKNGQDVFRYIDSADIYYSIKPKLAQQYLDSIPEPVTASIAGSLAEYYQLKALINDRLNEGAKEFQNFLLALKYAEQEQKYDIAGMSSIELFYNTIIVNDGKADVKYLEQAKAFYTLDNNYNGLIEVNQMYAYIEMHNNNFKKSNELTLQHLEEYKNITDDGYYYMYALFMLSSNYTHLYNIDKAHKYLYHLERIKNDTTISPPLHDAHLVTIYTCLADEHLKQKEIDSTFIYLNKAKPLRKFMNDADVENYYTVFLNYYDSKSDLKNKKKYVDSLQLFHENELAETIDASLEINTALLHSERQLRVETKKKYVNRYYILGLVIVLLGLISLVVVKYNTFKKRINKFIKKDSEYAYLQSNHEKLKVKVKGLEGYIEDIKHNIKQIATISDVNDQKNEIKQMYKSIHLNSSTLLNKSENHLELINELNVAFFNKMSSKHPELTSSDLIICYYIHTGFKNKEISVFLNTTERSIESKRYRIGKKLQLKDKSVSLLDYLTQL